MLVLATIRYRHVPKGGAGGAGGARAPPDFGKSEGAQHYYVPPQIFRLWHMPENHDQKFQNKLACSLVVKSKNISMHSYKRTDIIILLGYRLV